MRVVWKPTLKGPEAITQMCLEANASPACVGVITWMHTFSPAKMWIDGLTQLGKPLAHLHTQFNRELPWSQIDMDFMNLNQSAHGDREFGFIAAPASGSTARSWSATGRTARSSPSSTAGRASRARSPSRAS